MLHLQSIHLKFYLHSKHPSPQHCTCSSCQNNENKNTSLFFLLVLLSFLVAMSLCEFQFLRSSCSYDLLLCLPLLDLLEASVFVVVVSFSFCGIDALMGCCFACQCWTCWRLVFLFSLFWCPCCCWCQTRTAGASVQFHCVHLLSTCSCRAFMLHLQSIHLKFYLHSKHPSPQHCTCSSCWCCCRFWWWCHVIVRVSVFAVFMLLWFAALLAIVGLAGGFCFCCCRQLQFLWYWCSYGLLLCLPVLDLLEACVFVFVVLMSLLLLVSSSFLLEMSSCSGRSHVIGCVSDGTWFGYFLLLRSNIVCMVFVSSW